MATKAGIPWKIVHIELFKTKSEAYSRERTIKTKKSRKHIEQQNA